MQKLIVTGLLIAFAFSATAAPKSELIPYWSPFDDKATRTVDHGVWDDFLKRYVVSSADGINRVRYQAVTAADKSALGQYLKRLQNVPVRSLSRAEQLPYWINLYNALTVKVILDHYPVSSIMKIGISPGWFSRGPWGAKLLKIEGRAVSLDNIEHGILRPIWRDPRIHYAVNCASLGCPNLRKQAFTAANSDSMLEQAAAEFINHQRAAHVVSGRLVVSSIYHWFKSDFGGSDSGVIAHLRRFAQGEKAKRLKMIDKIYDHQYDWKLNGG